MITEKSCGAIVFTRKNGMIQYVIIQSREGIYGFPKGHTEANESDIQTALREVREETGLSVTFLDGFRTEDSHLFAKNGEIRTKHIVYFLASYENQVPVAQESELRNILLLDYESALSVFQFESSKQLLTQAHSFLTRAKNYPIWYHFPYPSI